MSEARSRGTDSAGWVQAVHCSLLRLCHRPAAQDLHILVHRQEMGDDQGGWVRRHALFSYSHGGPLHYLQFWCFCMCFACGVSHSRCPASSIDSLGFPAREVGNFSWEMGKVPPIVQAIDHFICQGKAMSRHFKLSALHLMKIAWTSCASGCSDSALLVSVSDACCYHRWPSSLTPVQLLAEQSLPWSCMPD